MELKDGTTVENAVSYGYDTAEISDVKISDVKISDVRLIVVIDLYKLLMWND